MPNLRLLGIVTRPPVFYTYSISQQLLSPFLYFLFFNFPLYATTKLIKSKERRISPKQALKRPKHLWGQKNVGQNRRSVTHSGVCTELTPGFRWARGHLTAVAPSPLPKQQLPLNSARCFASPANTRRVLSPEYNLIHACSIQSTCTRFPLRDVVGLKSRGCRKLKRESIIIRRAYVLRVLLHIVLAELGSTTRAWC